MPNQIDVNEIADVLNNKVDLDMGNLPNNIDYVVDSQTPTSSNGYKWYRLYKSGWIVQGGKYSGATQTITLPKAMADSNYNILIQESRRGGTNWNGNPICYADQTVNGFSVNTYGDYTNIDGAYWRVEGVAGGS